MATLQNAAVANANGSTLSTIGWNSALITVNCSVACTGGTTITFQGGDNLGNYTTLVANQVGSLLPGSLIVNQGTTVTVWIVNVATLTTIRTPITSYSAGTITVTA